MRILLCNSVYLVIVCATAYLLGAVLWQWLVGVLAFETTSIDGEDDEPVEDDPADWDRARERWMDREVGIW